MLIERSVDVVGGANDGKSLNLVRTGVRLLTVIAGIVGSATAKGEEERNADAG